MSGQEHILTRLKLCHLIHQHTTIWHTRRRAWNKQLLTHLSYLRQRRPARHLQARWVIRPSLRGAEKPRSHTRGRDGATRTSSQGDGGIITDVFRRFVVDFLRIVIQSWSIYCDLLITYQVVLHKYNALMEENNQPWSNARETVF